MNKIEIENLLFSFDKKLSECVKSNDIKKMVQDHNNEKSKQPSSNQPDFFVFRIKKQNLSQKVQDDGQKGEE
jgi:hypothetical protein